MRGVKAAIGLLGVVSLAPLGAEPEPGMAQLKAGFETAVEAASTSRRYLPTMDYARALDAAERTLQSRADLDGVLAIRAERKRYAKDGRVPTVDDGTPHAEVLRLRQEYAACLRNLEVGRAREILALYVQQTNRLDLLEKQRTRDGQIDMALEARRERERTDLHPRVTAAKDRIGSEEAETPPSRPSSDSVDLGTILETATLTGPVSTDLDATAVAEALNAFSDALWIKGVRLRVATDRLPVSGVSFAEGRARFLSSSTVYLATRRLPPSDSAPGGGLRVKPALAAFCTRMGVTYCADEARRDIILATAPSAPGEPLVSERDLDGALDAVRFPDSRSTYWDISNPESLVTRLSNGLAGKGVRLAISTTRLPLTGMTWSAGRMTYQMPYVSRVSSVLASGSRCEFADDSARTLLHILCATLALGYKFLPTTGEIVIVEAGAPDARWSSTDLAPPAVREAMRTEAGKRSQVGRTVLVSGRPSRVWHSFAESSFLLDDSVRAVFSRDRTVTSAFEEMRNRLAEVEKQSRSYGSYGSGGSGSYIEVSVLGEVANSSTANLLVLEKCRLIGSRNVYVYRESVYRDHDRGTTGRIKKLGEK